MNVLYALNLRSNALTILPFDIVSMTAVQVWPPCRAHARSTTHQPAMLCTPIVIDAEATERPRVLTYDRRAVLQTLNLSRNPDLIFPPSELCANKDGPPRPQSKANLYCKALSCAGALVFASPSDSLHA